MTRNAVAWSAVLAACAGALALLFAQVRYPFPFLNDAVLHFGLIESLQSAHSRGQSLLDPWVPSWNLGYPVFHYYQNLPHLAVLAMSKLTLGNLSLLHSFRLLEWLAIGTLPIPVFLALREFGFPISGAACAAVLSLLIRTNYLHGMDAESYVWQGLGLFTQAVGVWFLFPALSSSFLAVRYGGRTMRKASILVTVTTLSHLALGTMALMAAGIFAIAGRRQDLRRRILRLVLLAGITVAASSYSLVPIFRDFAYYNVSTLVPAWKYDSFGLAVILPWLVRGQLFDFHRFPIVTMLAGAGLVWMVLRARREKASRSVLFCFLFFLLLYFGRPTWGSLLRVLPLGEGFHYSRVLVMVHLFGIVMAGMALGAAIDACCNWRALSPRVAAVVAIAGAIALLSPALMDRTRYLLLNAKLARESAAGYVRERDDLETAVALAKGDRNGRVYAGLGPAGGPAWGGAFMVGWVPVYDWLPFREVDALGYLHHMCSLNADLHDRFNERSPIHYRVFGVNRILAPAQGVQLPPFAKPIATKGRFEVLQAGTSGFVELVDAPYSVNVHKRDLNRAQQAWLASELPARGIYPRVRLLEAEPRDALGMDVAGYDVRYRMPEAAPAPGKILKVERRGEDFFVHARANRACTLLLKMTFHPGWKAHVDGHRAAPIHVMPSYVGVSLEPGEHEVLLRFDPGPEKKILALAGGVILLAFAFAGGRITP
ncbi:MAG TPA: hypothetical protein VFR10_07165 [bacterium]|nr:hypothetical protein [bacterium]